MPETWDEAAVRDERDRLLSEIRQLRAQVRSRPLIAQAQGLLQERYGLPDGETAFALLQRVSQEHNVKLRTLVGALLTVGRPDHDQELWFPGRRRQPAPRLTFAPPEVYDSGNRGAVLGAVLHHTLTLAGAERGKVMTADRASRGLRIEKQRGLTPEFLDHYDFVGDLDSVCMLPVRSGGQVTLKDVGVEPSYSPAELGVMLRSGSRAWHGVPLRAESGAVLGTVTAHFDHVLHGLPTVRTRALEATGDQAGRWLHWYHRTVLLDALERLHALGRAHRGRHTRRA
ncbi:ANTAR domain-containing protein [Streptomyces minutiscleroticus]|uniref:Transcription antitermination regulator n=1 Tax=Streptomyces minutiscleroticus TaxID=68238 RepID=A0A918KTZ2_9ACTN|nr:ANTAR domain-containing protein [Streptomyces minutiscleroticus]GGX75958.1 transcription antitermination regulator [Streptomyces minutiscleroticus]